MLLKIVKFLHILSAIIWIGGIIITILINRWLKKNMDLNAAVKTLSFIGKAIKTPMRISLLFSIITGFTMIILKKIPLIDLHLYESSLGKLILVKIIIATIIILLLPLHSKLEKELVNANNQEVFKKTRRKLLLVGWIIFVFSLLFIYIGTSLRYIL